MDLFVDLLYKKIQLNISKSIFLWMDVLQKLKKNYGKDKKNIGRRKTPSSYIYTVDDITFRKKQLFHFSCNLRLSEYL